MLQIIIDYGKLGVPVVTTLLPTTLLLRTSTTFAKEISGSGPPPMTTQPVSCCRHGRTRSPCICFSIINFDTILIPFSSFTVTSDHIYLVACRGVCRFHFWRWTTCTIIPGTRSRGRIRSFIDIPIVPSCSLN